MSKVTEELREQVEEQGEVTVDVVAYLSDELLEIIALLDCVQDFPQDDRRVREATYRARSYVRLSNSHLGDAYHRLSDRADRQRVDGWVPDTLRSFADDLERRGVEAVE